MANGNGNGKMTSPGAACEVLEGQRGFEFVDPKLASAIDWVRAARHQRHTAGCHCQRCLIARPIVRTAIRLSTCVCGWCPICWLKVELSAGRL